ncbi:MAG: HpaII family restriction endonuclease [Alphaproteobacteria bacterium]
MLTGNKGEWTEAYVFLRLLAEGKLSADHQLEDIPTAAFPIIKIIREETAGARDYAIIDGDVHIVDAVTQENILKVPKSVFAKEADDLLGRIKKAKGRSNSFPESEDFLKSVDVNSLSAPSTDKSDIHLMVHDYKTGQNPTLGFSIKSTIGQQATLLNPGAGTNFIYKITPPSDIDIKKINTETYIKSSANRSLSKITLRIQELLKLGCTIDFVKVQSDMFNLNLSLIESDLPKLISYMLLYRYRDQTSYTRDLVSILTDENPLSYDLSRGHQFYHYKIKKFLTDAALGMTPETMWTGIHDATGGFIIARPSGEIGCYHIYNKNDFETYLITSTKLEQPSTGEDEQNPGFPQAKPKKPYLFGWIYEEDGKYFIKFNLQIRFL